jgi:hypothetical protein
VFTKQHTVEQIIEAREKRGEGNIGFLFLPEQDNIFHDKTNLVCDMIDYFVEHYNNFFNSAHLSYSSCSTK